MQVSKLKVEYCTLSDYWGQTGSRVTCCKFKSQGRRSGLSVCVCVWYSSRTSDQTSVLSADMELQRWALLWFYFELQIIFSRLSDDILAGVCCSLLASQAWKKKKDPLFIFVYSNQLSLNKPVKDKSLHKYKHNCGQNKAHRTKERSDVLDPKFLIWIWLESVRSVSVFFSSVVTDQSQSALKMMKTQRGWVCVCVCVWSDQQNSLIKCRDKPCFCDKVVISWMHPRVGQVPRDLLIILVCH